MRVLIPTCLAALVLSASANAETAPHPRLLFDAADVPTLRARLAGPLAPVAAAIEGGVAFPYAGGNFPKTADLTYEYFDDRRALADTIASYAFAALMFGDDSAPIGAQSKQIAHSYLISACNFDSWVFPETQDSPQPDLNLAHFLMSVSLAYDWLYGSLTESERQSCRDKVASEGAKMYEAAKTPRSPTSAWWIDEYMQNHHWINHAGLGMAALAFEGEIPRDTAAWLTTATEAMKNAHAVLDIVEGGAWHEGIGYVDYGLDALLPFSMANQKNKAGFDYADNRLMRDYARLRLYGMPSAKGHRREHVIYGDFSGFTGDNTLAPVRWLARAKKDTRAAWYADAYTLDGNLTSWPPSHRGMILASILYDETVKPEAPPGGGAAWALDYFAGDLSLFLARGGWSEGDALLGVKSGVFGGRANFERLKVNGAPGGTLDFAHDHADDMTVFFFADGEWLTSTVPAYFIGRANGSVEGNRTRYANSLLVDGQGQLGEGIRTCGFGTCSWFWDRVSSIPLRGSTAHYTFSLSAGSQLYDRALGLQTFGRAILFVDRAIPVVRDVVRADRPHRFELVWHAIDGATREGEWLALTAKNDRILGVKMLAPEGFAIETEGQSTLHLDKFDPDGRMTAVMVRPPADATATTFLSVLVPSRGSTWSSRPRVDPIDREKRDRGVALADSDIVFADGPTETASAAGMMVTGMAGVRKRAPMRAMLAAGSKLSIDGIPWIEVLDGAPASLEVEPSASVLVASGDAKSARVYAPSVTRVTYNGEDVPFIREGDFVVFPRGAPRGGVDAAVDGVGIENGGAGREGLDAGLPATNNDAPRRDSDAGCGCFVHRTRDDATFGGLLLAALTLLRRRRRKR